MNNIHLANVDDDDEIYSGFNDVPSGLKTDDLEENESFQEAVRTSYGRRSVATGNRMYSSGGRLSMYSRQGIQTPGRSQTGIFRPSTMSDGNYNRPITAVRGVGFTSVSAKPIFDPLNQATKSGPAPPLDSKIEESPETRIKRVERKVTELVEESCLANARGEIKLGLEKAKEASSKEKNLIRQREQAGLTEAHNLDLTFSVCALAITILKLLPQVLFNLANHYAANDMFTEALNIFKNITERKVFTNAGRLQINMGNIYFKLGQYVKAIKLYQRALDRIPSTQKMHRIKVTHNIGLVYLKMGQFNDACASFEYIMNEHPSFLAGLDLVTSYYLLNDKEGMKKAFSMLLQVPFEFEDDDKYHSTNDDTQSQLILEVIKNDSLRQIERFKKQEMERCILSASKLISPVLEASFSEGYTWCVEAIKKSPHADLANDLEINKAVMYLRQREFSQAIETLTMFEKKESKVASTAATNLTFLYFLQGDLSQAEKYAEAARDADRYNPHAFVNLGNCCFERGDFEKAKEHYVCALDCDASCTEALYNLGLANKRLGLYDEALEVFFKLYAILRNYPEVVYQLANLQEKIGEIEQALEWYLQLLSLVPSDPYVLKKVGRLFEETGDKQQAYHYHFDSYRHYPSNIEVIDWLGSYFIEHQVAEKAITYFEKASLIEPDEVKWHLMIASCHRRSGNYQLAFQTYKNIHWRFPDNVECLRLLVRLCTDMGMKKESDEYFKELKKAEKAKELKERVGSSRPGSRYGSGKVSRMSSASSYDLEVPASAAIPKSPHSRSNSRIAAASAISRSSYLSLEDEVEYPASKPRQIDASYRDPLGPMTERPKTSSRKKEVEDEFDNEELGDDLLPQ